MTSAAAGRVAAVATASPPLYEMKFELDADQTCAVERVLRAVLAPAELGVQRSPVLSVASLYYDTADLAAYRGAHGCRRRKYRVRCYGDPSTIHLERKSRSRGRVRLRATAVAAADLPRLNIDDADDAWDGAWFRAKLSEHSLRPSCLVGCDRTAYRSDNTAEPAWVTIDRDLKCGRVFDLRVAPDFAGVPIAEPHAVLEVRFPATLPAAIRRLIGDVRLEPRGFSKYRKAVDTLGLRSAAGP